MRRFLILIVFSAILSSFAFAYNFCQFKFSTSADTTSYYNIYTALSKKSILEIQSLYDGVRMAIGRDSRGESMWDNAGKMISSKKMITGSQKGMFELKSVSHKKC